ncbi:ATP-grasp domain-containing protein [Phytohabitans rumicis]|uniref:Phosphoribosylglycinamide formyltransferase 2 n=1 Tax=Phytohabitans rumicis TaxID=1076125 RepID=A0A6V8KWH8_9ACTN|nr:ATP-grasp domain-containing protein [Phytohabitans rumicis]GFJ86751.1 phosphoribosylglycinamide formyltransferase 2 [Phytohabitans rumicis]
MTAVLDSFVSRLKAALLPSTGTPLVFLGNFEVEERWGAGEPGLPRVALSASDAVVNRMDEFAMLLGGPDDYVLLKGEPDAAYLDYLGALGVPLPRLLVAEHTDPHRTVTRDVLASPGLLDRLAALAGTAALYPHGVSADEEELAARTGIGLAAPTAAVCRTVNSKIYSRQVADALGLRQPPGWTCETVEEFEAAVERGAALVAAGGTVVAKDAFGVSGKGLLVVDEPGNLERLRRMVLRRAERSGQRRLSLLIEQWVAKRADLNYQFTVGRDASVHFDFVKEAITANGVHKGHRMPARLDGRQVAELTGVAGALGARLAADGYYGVVGVDAMVDPDGGLYPVVEINARNNMSTYQVSLQERFLADGAVALARQYPLRLTRPLPFGAVRDAVGDLLLRGTGQTGLLVHNFATVNAAAPGGDAAAAFDGRLYGLLIADTPERLDAMDNEIARRLAGAMEGAQP